ncbi:type 1 fimbrial protein [Pseudomonas putida]|nr:type 1 fimbrial protein [Pseudomonas putida]
MKRSFFVFLTLAWMTFGQVMPATAAPYCRLSGGTPLLFQSELPPILNIDADKKPGQSISGDPIILVIPSSSGDFVCENDTDTPIILAVKETTGVAPIKGPGGVPVLRTNIPGVGVSIFLNAPLSGFGDNDFKPYPSGSDYVPYQAVLGRTPVGKPMVFQKLSLGLQLIKLDEAIPPGVHWLNTSLFDASTSIGSINPFMQYQVIGRIVSNPCTIPKTSSPAVVQLNAWPKSEFTKVGHTTASTNFSIELTNCKADPEDKTRVQIRLTGINGSARIPGMPDNVFSLTSDSGAKGVGIELLKGEGDRIPLDQDVDIANLTDGVIRLDFKAHYYQTLSPDKVEPGPAHGALSFTISYR